MQELTGEVLTELPQFTEEQGTEVGLQSSQVA